MEPYEYREYQGVDRPAVVMNAVGAGKNYHMPQGRVIRRLLPAKSANHASKIGKM